MVFDAPPLNRSSAGTELVATTRRRQRSSSTDCRQYIAPQELSDVINNIRKKLGNQTSVYNYKSTFHSVKVRVVNLSGVNPWSHQVHHNEMMVMKLKIQVRVSLKSKSFRVLN